MRIEVTADDINYGTSQNPHNCPVARAVKRALPGLFICVRQDRVFIHDAAGKRVSVCELPEIAREFVRKFDVALLKFRFREVSPFAFHLPLETILA